MSNIQVHQNSQPMRIRVVKSERISPHFQRVTFTGLDLRHLVWQGNDQWVRLFFPTDDERSFDYVPNKLTMGTYVKMLTVPSRRRPIIRNYTLRQWRPEDWELDIDFVVHGDQGVAGPWAVGARPGAELMMIDQGCGWPGSPGAVVIAADETALPAAVGIVRDLPSQARGVVFIEIPDERDAQPVVAPQGVEVQWLVRDATDKPGSLALNALMMADLPSAPRHAFGIGEASLATGVRRHLVKVRGWEKSDVSFCGYWKYKPL